ncbi:MAG: kinase, partial [Oscillospiraceae bacterium]|nr:kinase [Oscillospiraceae bacterium]
ISTATIEKILDCAIANGAYGGKINGSGGGGCCFVYAPRDKAEAIIEAVGKLGYPGKILVQDTGVRVD